MAAQEFDYGMIGLGTMGRNLVYNMSDHGFFVAGYDKDPAKVDAFVKESLYYSVLGASTVEEFIASLKTPRVILMLVPAGPIVDSVIEELKPLLSKDDLLIDCGNSHFTDTNRRIESLAKENLHFMGIGVSGGESGARRGPSIMPGGNKEVYARVAPMLEAVAAKVNGEPCVAYLGSGSAGQYVKMVHNGIEYALMQLIAETYHLLKEYGKLNNSEFHDIFTKWNAGSLQSFLIEITAEIFAKKDELTGNDLVDMILDSASQKGTGMWTSQDAMSLHVPITTIDAAVSMRDLSANKKARQAAEQKLHGKTNAENLDKNILIQQAEQAFHFAMIVTYAQGLSQLQKASQEYHYGLNLAEVAKIWRGGCIIRAALLEDIRAAFAQEPDLPNLLVSDIFANQLNNLQESIRAIVKTAVSSGIPMPATVAALTYFDAYRRGWLPANLIQAQRDYFGAHTYQRTDREGTFHTQWSE
ncbi:MAG: NADP-dependent phosphogluconate dehydrogenase [Saprospiraceae bacterium]|nr:NADP-dependent phosphogluconate dehydrogenase [Saprospiraceae bacterium]